MATKRVTSKSAANAEKSAAGAVPARVAKPATPRVKSVKHSKAAVTEFLTSRTLDAPSSVADEAGIVTTGITLIEDPHTAISRIAYEFWAERGYQGGNPDDDWFRAEAEYRQRLAAL